MGDGDAVGDRDTPALIAHTPAQVKVLGVQEIAFVESADLRKRLPWHQHEGARHGVDIAQYFVARRQLQSARREARDEPF